MGKVLGIVTRTISTHLAHKAGLTRCEAPTGAVTLIQRFGSALNLNIHFHMLFLDGVYVQDSSCCCFTFVATDIKPNFLHCLQLNINRFASILTRCPRYATKNQTVA